MQQFKHSAKPERASLSSNKVCIGSFSTHHKIPPPSSLREVIRLKNSLCSPAQLFISKYLFIALIVLLNFFVLKF
jgi:hypothetical protein